MQLPPQTPFTQGEVQQSALVLHWLPLLAHAVAQIPALQKFVQQSPLVVQGAFTGAHVPELHFPPMHCWLQQSPEFVQLVPFCRQTGAPQRPFVHCSVQQST